MTVDSWRFPHPDPELRARAMARQAELTKPRGSLGQLESLAVELAAWQVRQCPVARPASAILFAADHPVARHGVSAYPQEVTAAMVQNFVAGGAAASVLARRQQIPLAVVDVGVARRVVVPNAEVRFVRDAVADAPAGDIRTEDALTQGVFTRCVEAGARAVDRFADDAEILILGEMGIGNTTPSAAIAAALLGGDPDACVGAGTGVAGPVLAHKRAAVRDALARLGEERHPLEVCRRVGGREIAALVGAMACAARARKTVLVDGFIVTVAALVLARLEPAIRPALVFSHRSHEQAHSRVLEALGARPLLDLDLCLGEGSGALLAFPLVELACALHAEMATFTSASVPTRTQS